SPLFLDSGLDAAVRQLPAMTEFKMRVREGCRGGQEQFKWNSIKDQDFKDRECYLGQSSKVGTMSKFGKYYKHDWYAQSRDTAENISEERQSVQAFEEELMQEALGLKPKKLLLAKVQMNEQELKEFLKAKKGEDKNGREVMGPQRKIMTNEYGEQVSTSNEEYIGDAFRDAQIKGLGFAHHRDAKLEKIKAEVMGTKSELKGKEAPAAPPPVKGEVKEEIDESK
ncbi:unnamed protein product, partial [Polarella glacialis]